MCTTSLHWHNSVYVSSNFLLWNWDSEMGLTTTYRRRNRALGIESSRQSSPCRSICQICSSRTLSMFQKKKQPIITIIFFLKKNWLLAYCSLTTLLSDSECSSDFTWNWKQQAVLGRECPQIQSCRTHSMNRTPLASSTPWEGSAHRHYHEQPEFCCISFTGY